MESGPYIYELFSVMIHSGSANGGHYYAYIKSLAETQWYSFNDQHVQKITPEEVFKTFGGSPTRYWNSVYIFVGSTETETTELQLRGSVYLAVLKSQTQSLSWKVRHSFYHRLIYFNFATRPISATFDSSAHSRSLEFL